MEPQKSFDIVLLSVWRFSSPLYSQGWGQWSGESWYPPTWSFCFSYGSYYSDKTHDRKELGEEKVYSTLPRAVHHPGQEPGGRTWCRGHGQMLLTSLRFMASIGCFLVQSRTACPGMAQPTMGWALLHQSLIKNTLHRLAYSPVLWRDFSVVDLSSQLCIPLCQIVQDNQDTLWQHFGVPKAGDLAPLSPQKPEGVSLDI